MFLVTCLSIVFPAGLGDKADPLITPDHIRPEWYFFWAFRWLKLMPDQIAVVTQGLFLALIAGWPLVDSWIRKRRPDSEASTVFGTAGVLLLLALTLWETLDLLT